MWQGDNVETTWKKAIDKYDMIEKANEKAIKELKVKISEQWEKAKEKGGLPESQCLEMKNKENSRFMEYYNKN